MMVSSLASAFLISEIGTSGPTAYSTPAIQAVISQSSAVSRVSESSGVCPSRRATGLFWTVNDANNPAVLHTITTAGAVGNPVTVTGNGVSNTDWEDLQSFRFAGKPWLMIADTGDNSLIRSNLALYLMEEPAPGTATVAITARQVIDLPDGARNIEAIGVDPIAQVVLMADKNTRGASEVYQIPLSLTSGSFSPVPTGELATRSGPTGRISGMMISRDGTRAVFISAAAIAIRFIEGRMPRGAKPWPLAPQGLARLQRHQVPQATPAGLKAKRFVSVIGRWICF